MTFKSYFYTATAFICFGSLSVPAHAGQLFPPANIGTRPNVSCPSGSVLTWHGDHVDCADPTPGVTVSCPAGQIMTGIANGQAVCVATPTQTYGGAYMLNRDNSCRYPNPFTGDCSCPTSATAHQSFDFINGDGSTCPNSYYFDLGQHGNNCGVIGFTCVY